MYGEHMRKIHLISKIYCIYWEYSQRGKRDKNSSQLSIFMLFDQCILSSNIFEEHYIDKYVHLNVISMMILSDDYRSNSSIIKNVLSLNNQWNI
jgi:hypothetical protein